MHIDIYWGKSIRRGLELSSHMMKTIVSHFSVYSLKFHNNSFDPGSSLLNALITASSSEFCRYGF